MQSISRSKIKAVVSALFESFNSPNQNKSKVQISKAHRVGPQRVILKITLDGNLDGFQVDRVDIAGQTLSFDVTNADNENISVSLLSQASGESFPAPTNREHRVTLKVKPETNRLTMTFRDSAHQVHHIEQIKIQ